MLEDVNIKDDVAELAKLTPLPTDEGSLAQAIAAAQESAISAGCEGIIVKSTDSLYDTSGTRVNSWVKLKNVNLHTGAASNGEAGTASIRDSLDLIPIGGYFGKGSRTGVYGSYLMAAYNRERRCFESVCKLGTGFSQKQLAELHQSTELMDEEDAGQAARMAQEIYKVSTALKPDVWFKPTQIWEVQADSFTVSKVHQAGKHALKVRQQVDGGLSLRFPRFVRTRSDKRFRIPVHEFLDEARSNEFDEAGESNQGEEKEDDSMEIGTSVEEILRMYLGSDQMVK